MDKNEFLMVILIKYIILKKINSPHLSSKLNEILLNLPAEQQKIQKNIAKARYWIESEKKSMEKIINVRRILVPFYQFLIFAKFELM